MASQATQLTSAEVLRRARQRRGESLEQVAQRTRISEHYLEALERDAPIGEFPSPMYARLFLRTYARYLGLPADPLVGDFARRHRVPRVPRLGMLPVPAPRNRTPDRAPS